MLNQQQTHIQNKLYRHLLAGGKQNDPSGFLQKLLYLFVNITGAEQGYIELQDSKKNIFWSSMSYSRLEIQNIRNAISKGIIAAALQYQKPMKTVSAISDHRFRSRESVRSAKIKAVLCVPICARRIQGVIYLQGGDGFKADADENIRDAKLIAKHIKPLIKQIYFHNSILPNKDHTAYLRKKYMIENIIGCSKALEKVLKTGLTIAPLDINILLTGDTGTGKTQFAEMIHQNSSRKNGPFVSLNCAALPEALMENELFGSAKGGHSGAINPVQGKVIAAEKGTLFLDEIGELPIGIQAKLLQLLQSGLYYPLGSPKPVRADIRILTATNMDLNKAIQEKRFREDLYYRIKIFCIHMPALSERESDIYELAEFFCKRSCKKHGLAKLTISYSVMNMLSSKKFNGNIRELEHTIEAAVIYATLEEKNEILRRHLFPSQPVTRRKSCSTSNFKEATLMFQRQYLKENLNVHKWNISRTAKELTISRSQLNNLIKKFQLNR